MWLILHTSSRTEINLSLLMPNRKCLLLFTVALCSTILFFFVFWNTNSINNIGPIWGKVFMSLDLSVNTVCLYLQFTFAKTLYSRCCEYPDSCCRWCIGLRIKRWTKRNRRKSRQMSIRSCSPSAAPTSSSAHSVQPNSLNLSSTEVGV